MNRRYEHWHRGVSVLTRRLDFILPRLVIGLVLVMVLAQGLLRSPLFLRLYTSLDRSEAARRMAYEELGAMARVVGERTVSTQATGSILTLELVDARPSKRVKVLLNGEIIASFRKATLVIPVDAGDLVEIDCSDEPTAVTVRVETVTADLAEPEQGQYLQAHQEIRPLGRVRLKEGN